MKKSYVIKNAITKQYYTGGSIVRQYDNWDKDIAHAEEYFDKEHAIAELEKLVKEFQYRTFTIKTLYSYGG